MNAPGLEQKLWVRALRFSWIKDVVQAVAFTAAGIWAIYTFWYRETYLPRVTDANIALRVQLDVLGQKDGVVAVRARTLIDNPGKATARILAVGLAARGLSAQAGPPEKLDQPPMGELKVGEYVAVDRTQGTKGELIYDAIGVREPFDNRTNETLRPDGHVESETVLFVRRGAHDLLGVEAQVSWMPLGIPPSKDCYKVDRDAEGVVFVTVTGKRDRNCRLSTSVAATSVSLW
jgi:hypothetical protein